MRFLTIAAIGLLGFYIYLDLKEQAALEAHHKGPVVTPRVRMPRERSKKTYRVGGI